MRVTILDKPWQLRFVSRLANDGDCNHDERIIRVKRGQAERDELDTVIHEAIHAAFPWMREWLVLKFASNLAGTLWKLGYRKV